VFRNGDKLGLGFRATVKVWVRVSVSVIVGLADGYDMADSGAEELISHTPHKINVSF